MILRSRHNVHALSCALLVLSLAAVGASAQEEADCRLAIGDFTYDLNSLEGVKTVSRERDTPPTKYKDTVTFDLCGSIPKTDAPDNEQVSAISVSCEVYSTFLGPEPSLLRCLLVSLRNESMSDENESQRERLGTCGRSCTAGVISAGRCHMGGYQL